jgi:hypothetical protein
MLQNVLVLNVEVNSELVVPHNFIINFVSYIYDYMDNNPMYINIYTLFYV